MRGLLRAACLMLVLGVPSAARADDPAQPVAQKTHWHNPVTFGIGVGALAGSGLCATIAALAFASHERSDAANMPDGGAMTASVLYFGTSAFLAIAAVVAIYDGARPVPDRPTTSGLLLTPIGLGGRF